MGHLFRFGLFVTSKMLVTSGGGIGIIEPRDDATTFRDVRGDEVSCDGGNNKSWACMSKTGDEGRDKR